MSEFHLHDHDTTSDAGRRALDRAQSLFGFAPNLIRIMAESPPLAEAYLRLGELLADSALTPKEQQVVLLTVSRTNGCTYCVAAHTMTAQQAGLSADTIAALRDGRELDDARLEALRRFTGHLVETRGWVEPAELAAFQAAGYGNEHVLSVILGVGMKTLSNYTNHIANTPLDDAMQDAAWSPS